MLKHRFITSSILMPLVVLFIFNLSTDIAEWFLVCVMILAAWEWFIIIGIRSIKQLGVSFIVLVMVGASAWLSLNPNNLSLLVILLWILATLLIIYYANIALPILIFTLIPLYFPKVSAKEIMILPEAHKILN